PAIIVRMRSAYGRAARTRSWARRILAAETISIARVICDVLRTERMRRRISRGVANLAPPLAVWHFGQSASRQFDSGSLRVSAANLLPTSRQAEMPTSRLPRRRRQALRRGHRARVLLGGRLELGLQLIIHLELLTDGVQHLRASRLQV